MHKGAFAVEHWGAHIEKIIYLLQPWNFALVQEERQPIDPSLWNLSKLPQFTSLKILLVLSRESGNDPYKPSLVVSFKGTPGFIPSFPTEHQQASHQTKKKEVNPHTSSRQK